MLGGDISIWVMDIGRRRRVPAVRNPIVYWEEIVSKKGANKYTVSNSNEFYKEAMNPTN
jgi:hypothetical protein